MLNLAFDTTAGSCSVILTEDGKTVGKIIEKMDFGQAEALFPAIEKIMNENRLKPADLDLITVCTGPGSFTGVRSSLAAARTLGLALPSTGLTGVSAFEAYIQDLAPDELAFYNAVIFETKREDFYFQCFDAGKNKTGEPEALEYDAVIDRLRHKKVTLTGDGVERFLSRPSGLSLHVIRTEDCLPVEALAACGSEKYRLKKLDYPKPLYLRAPDVCVKA